ncbi:MAG: MFS transporter [Rhodobacteraceae bacterium]|nr:MFS transporter [Paracoccaceae bacterium]
MALSRARWVMLGGVWLIYFCFGLTIASMAPLVSLIAADLGASNAAMGAVLGAWPLTYIAAAIPCGILLDRLGVRVTLFAATVIMAASGVARGMADTTGMLMLAVALFGIGGPMISVGAPKLIAGLFEGPSRGTAMGIYITGPYLGGMTALALTNAVALPAMGDWRGVMFLYAGLVMVSGVIWLVLTGLAGPAARAEGEGKKFSLAAFAEILGLPAVRIVLAMSVGIFFINHGLNNWLPELLRAKGLDPVRAGYWAALSSAVGVIGALTVPRLATPERRMAVMAALFTASLAASLLLHLAPGPLLAAGLVAQGVARGSMMTVAILILMETRGIARDRLGLAGGMFFTTAEVGGVLGPVVFGALSQWTGGFAAPLVAVSAICGGLLALLAALVRTQQKGGGKSA